MPTCGSLEEWLRALERRRQRSIRTLAVPLSGNAPSGAWIPMASSDYLIYPESASPTRKEAALCHEVAHILLGHQPALHTSLTPALLEQIAPSLSLKAARAVLLRTGYTTHEEADAEIAGTLLATGLGERRMVNAWESTSHLSSRIR